MLNLLILLKDHSHLSPEIQKADDIMLDYSNESYLAESRNQYLGENLVKYQYHSFILSFSALFFGSAIQTLFWSSALCSAMQKEKKRYNSGMVSFIFLYKSYISKDGIRTQ